MKQKYIIQRSNDDGKTFFDVEVHYSNNENEIITIYDNFIKLDLKNRSKTLTSNPIYRLVKVNYNVI